MTDERPTEGRKRKPGENRVSQTVRDQRVTAIMGWMAHGLRPKHIPAAVAEAGKIERDARRNYRAGLAAFQRAKLDGRETDDAGRPLVAPTPPRFVWGDSDPPVSGRQVERYVAAARVRFTEEGRELNRGAVEVLGLTWHRINDLYRRCLDEKRYTTCRMLLRDTMEMFGLIGAIRVQLPPPVGAPGAPAAETGPQPTGPLPESQYTPDQLAREWNDLTAVIVKRMRETREAAAERRYTGGHTED